MLGLGTTNPMVDLEHLVVGGLFAYLGFGGRGDGFVGGLGAVYLFAFVLGFVVPALMGLYPDLSNGIRLAHLIHAALGVLSVAVAWSPQSVPAGSPEPGTRRRSPAPLHDLGRRSAR